MGFFYCLVIGSLLAVFAFVHIIIVRVVHRVARYLLLVGVFLVICEVIFLCVRITVRAAPGAVYICRQTILILIKRRHKDGGAAHFPVEIGM